MATAKSMKTTTQREPKNPDEYTVRLTPKGAQYVAEQARQQLREEMERHDLAFHVHQAASGWRRDADMGGALIDSYRGW